MTADQFKQLQAATAGKWGPKVLCVAHGGKQPAEAVEPDRGTPRKRRTSTQPPAEGMRLLPRERKDYGVTVTVREQDSGEVDVIVAYGSLADALAGVCEQLDVRRGDWRIITISTPATIFRDLQGMRDTVLQSIERNMLGRIGRRDLLEDDDVPRVIVRVVA